MSIDTDIPNIQLIKLAYSGMLMNTRNREKMWKGTSRQRSGKGAIVRENPTPKTRWENTK